MFQNQWFYRDHEMRRPQKINSHEPSLDTHYTQGSTSPKSRVDKYIS